MNQQGFGSPPQSPQEPWAPPGGTPPGPPGGPTAQEAPKPTWIGLGIGLGMLAFGCLCGGALTGILGAQSETMGVQAATGTVFPIGFGLAATLAALLTRKQKMAVAVGAPVGCGCFGALGAGVAFAVFMSVIWPQL